MTNLYTLGILEPNADNTLYLSVDGTDNETVLGAFAGAVCFNRGDDFSVADIIAELKTEHSDDLSIVGIHIENAPASDHTVHVYDAQEQTVELLDRLDGSSLVTFPLLKWTGRYGFHG